MTRFMTPIFLMLVMLSCSATDKDEHFKVLIETEALASTFARCDEIIGFNFLKGMHLNDSKKEFASRVKRPGSGCFLGMTIS